MSENEPEYCVALPMQPAHIESELKHGDWLVLAVAVWSAPDIAAIGTALDIAKSLDGQLMLGIRPFDDTAEFATWRPELTHEYRSPLWMLLHDGELLRHTAGLLSSDDVLSWMRLPLAQAV